MSGNKKDKNKAEDSSKEDKKKKKKSTDGTNNQNSGADNSELEQIEEAAVPIIKRIFATCLPLFQKSASTGTTDQTPEQAPAAPSPSAKV